MNRIDITNLLPIFFFGYAFSEVISSSALEGAFFLSFLKPLFMVIIALISLFELAQQKYPFKYFVIGILILILAFINAYVSSTFIILLNILAVFALSFNVYKIDKIIDSIGFGIFLGVIVVLLFFILKVIPDITIWQHGRWRQSLGFSWPVTLPNFYTAFAILIIFRNKNEKRKVILIIMLLLLTIPSYIIMKFTDGRSSFYSLLIVAIVIIFFEIVNIKKAKLSFFLSFMAKINLMIGIGFTLYISIMYPSSSLLKELNVFVTGRFSWFSTAWQQHKVNLIGNSLIGINDESIMLDNLYLVLLLRGGLLLFIIILYTIISLIKYFRDEEDYVSLVIVNVILANSIISASWLPIWKNVLIFSVANIINVRMYKRNPINLVCDSKR